MEADLLSLYRDHLMGWTHVESWFESRQEYEIDVMSKTPSYPIGTHVLLSRG